MVIKKLNNYFKDWSLFEKIWLFVFTLTILGLSLYWQDSLIGIVASLTGIWCVVLVAKGRISNYYVGLINVVAYAYVAWGWKYYGEVMLNIGYYFPAQFVGLYLWSKNKINDKEVEVKFMTNKSRILWSIVSVVGVISYGYLLKYLGGNLPFTDSLSTTLSVIAMVLMIWRYMEQWILWIIVDIASIILWFVVLLNGGNDISILIMWIAYLINAIYGLINWIKMYREQEVLKNV